MSRENAMVARGKDDAFERAEIHVGLVQHSFQSRTNDVFVLVSMMNSNCVESVVFSSNHTRQPPLSCLKKTHSLSKYCRIQRPVLLEVSQRTIIINIYNTSFGPSLLAVRLALCWTVVSVLFWTMLKYGLGADRESQQDATQRSSLSETEQSELGSDFSWILGERYYGFFRSNGPGQIVEPALDTRLHMEFDNSSAGRPHMPTGREERWRGEVVENDEGCYETDTTFCALSTKPPNIRFSSRRCAGWSLGSVDNHP